MIVLCVDGLSVFFNFLNMYILYLQMKTDRARFMKFLLIKGG